MTVITAIARAASNTALGNQDITDASFGGGTPKACIVLWGEGPTTGTPIDGARMSYGFATGAANQGCLSMNAQNNDVLVSDGRGQINSIAVIDVRVFGSGTQDGEAQFVSFITDGIRINWTNAISTASMMTVILFGGSDFEGHADNNALGIAGSVIDTTAPGFKPDIVLSLMQTSNSSGSAQLGNGMAWDNAGTIVQRTWSVYHGDGRNPTDISDSIFSSHGVATKFRTSGLVNIALDFTDFDADGFTTTVGPNSGVSTTHLYLAMKFRPNKIFMDTYTTPVATGDDVEAVGFKPQLVMITMLEELVAFATQTRGGTEGWSAINEASEFSHTTSAEDGVDPTISGTNTQSLSSALALNVPSGDGVPESVATLASFDASGYTLNYTTVPSTQRAYLQFVIGEDPVGGGNAATRRRSQGEEMSGIILRRKFLELTSAASRVESAPFLLGGNNWDVQLKAAASLCGMEGSNDLQEWDTMTDILGVAIESAGTSTRVGLERPKYLRFFVDIDVGEPQVFSAIIGVQKQQGS